MSELVVSLWSWLVERNVVDFVPGGSTTVVSAAMLFCHVHFYVG